MRCAMVENLFERLCMPQLMVQARSHTDIWVSQCGSPDRRDADKGIVLRRKAQNATIERLGNEKDLSGAELVREPVCPGHYDEADCKQG